ncbi:MAG: histidinol-phosphatase HisJ family protein [Oscillospiraceae bacterium]|nr:histidinol-phosphatase HisJ family protein [Oscillospiraceae bacterium]
MPYKNRLDLHAHTDNSFDGNHSTTFLCETARENGLRALAFTDHVEMDRFREDSFDRTALQSYFEGIKARSAFRGKLIVCVGVELGQPTYNEAESEALLQRYSYDIVLGSIHNLRGQKDFWFLPFDTFTPEQISAALNEYFEELLRLALWGRCDVLAHLSYPLRFLTGKFGIPARLDDYAELIDAILDVAVKNRLAVEINCSGMRQGCAGYDEQLLRRYRALGGERVTVGSDAHYAAHLGRGLEEGMDLALRCGFHHMTLFQRREAMMVEIV